MVMPFCTNGIDDMFEPHSWNLREFSDDCFKQWGVRPRPAWIITTYGGKNISAHTNIIFRWVFTDSFTDILLMHADNNIECSSAIHHVFPWKTEDATQEIDFILYYQRA